MGKGIVNFTMSSSNPNTSTNFHDIFFFFLVVLSSRRSPKCFASVFNVVGVPSNGSQQAEEQDILNKSKRFIKNSLTRQVAMLYYIHDTCTVRSVGIGFNGNEVETRSEETKNRHTYGKRQAASQGNGTVLLVPYLKKTGPWRKQPKNNILFKSLLPCCLRSGAVRLGQENLSRVFTSNLTSG